MNYSNVIDEVTRHDFAVIAKMMSSGASVLDTGCGSGELLSFLGQQINATAKGIEKNSSKVNVAIANGLSVMQGDIDIDLAYYPDNAYDFTVCVKALQATKDPKNVLRELVRIGKKTIISVPNFGHWRNRSYLGLRGRMPMSKRLSYHWYETPNIHFCTLFDMIELCEEMDIKILGQVRLNENGSAKTFHGKSRVANLLGSEGIFLLEGW